VKFGSLVTGRFLNRFFLAAESTVNFLLGRLNRMPGLKRDDGKLAKRILLTRMDSVGDVLMFSASLPAYRKMFDEHHLVLLVRQEVAEIVKGCPFVDEIWTIDEKRFRTNLRVRWHWCRRIYKAGFDIAVNTVFSNNFPEFDCLIGWTGASKRVAHRCDDRYGKRQRGWPHYTELAPSGKETRFEIDRNFDLLRYFGYRGETERITRIWTEQRRNSGEVGPRINSNDQPYAIVCPGARVQEKIWPAENFVAVVRRVNELFPIHWIVCGHPSERNLCESVADSLISSEVSAENLAGMTSLTQLRTLIEGALLCLGNDSAPLHFAAALEIPGICVLGGGHFGRFYPYPENPLTKAIFNMIPCYNCHWHCVLRERECLTQIPVESVVSAIVKTLHNVRQTATGVTDAAS
jgi:ADP-heptose:LPS heptosyltransferase